ncbi:MAG: type IV toxin-antitoxin system AbiEi family antitoxin domain-containing protein [Actinomycetota bacterium]|nr:type IV toxin-antitoxin system AbiEi family antitoxin domain-containing protein [Actinomycetota bacterium]
MARQHCVVALDQVTALGVSPSAVYQRTVRGRLFRIHRGVYSLTPPRLLSRDGRYMAAVLACGPGAVLSHRSAADLLELRATDRRRIEATIPGKARRSHRGVQIHRSRTLDPARDVTAIRGIPVTTPSRTMLDLADVLPIRAVERALDQAELAWRLDLGALEDQLRRNHGRHGAGRLRAPLADRREPALTANDLEERMLAICREAGLPVPEVNVLLVLPDGGSAIRPDFLWRAHRLIVETDGRRTHRTDQAFEGDRFRDQRVMLAGWRVVRITWRQLTGEPARIRVLLADLLSRTARPE